jgi:hypothetical protein
VYAIISTVAKVCEKDDSLYSSRCSVVGKIGVDGKKHLLYSKVKGGIKKE